VTQIGIWDLEADADPPQLRVSFQFTGHRQFTDPDEAGRTADQETLFTGMTDLVLQGTGPWPWQLSSGHVETLDEFLGYTFTSRQETPGEYAERTGSLQPPEAAGKARRFRLTAGFVDHDVRFGSSVTIEIQREAPPARDEAAQLVWSAIEQETARALGDGDWRPSLSSLDVVELLGG
jgi:hypothetical protein